MLDRRCQSAEAAEKRRDQSSRQRFPDERSIADVNGRKPVAKVRWIFGTTGSARTLHRGCQRAENGSRRRDEPSRQRPMHECFIADVNVQRLVEKTRWVFETTVTARTLHRGCQRAEAGRRRRDGPSMHTVPARMLDRRCQRAGTELRWRDRSSWRTLARMRSCSCQRAEKGSEGQEASEPLLFLDAFRHRTAFRSRTDRS